MRSVMCQGVIMRLTRSWETFEGEASEASSEKDGRNGQGRMEM